MLFVIIAILVLVALIIGVQATEAFSYRVLVLLVLELSSGRRKRALKLDHLHDGGSCLLHQLPTPYLFFSFLVDFSRMYRY